MRLKNMKKRLKKKYDKAKSIFEFCPDYMPRQMMHEYYFWRKWNKNFCREAYKEMKRARL